MNASIPMAPMQPGKGLSMGLAFSLAVHAAVLAWMVHALRTPQLEEPPARRMQVTLARSRPPEPVAPPKPAEPVPARPKAATPAARVPTPAPARPSATPKAETPAPARPVLSSPESASPVTAAPLPERQDATPSTFDPMAARAAARAYDRDERYGRGGGRRPQQEFKATRDEKLGEAIDRSRTPDCRGAYAGLGLLAVVPLAIDAVREGGCKW